MLCRHGKQDWQGSPPLCAFDENGNFQESNWNCFLMNALRDLVNPYRDDIFLNAECFWMDDIYRGIIYISGPESKTGKLQGAFAILKWYKSRGRTDGFWILKDDKLRKGTEEDALIIAELYQDHHDYDIEQLKAGRVKNEGYRPQK